MLLLKDSLFDEDLVVFEFRHETSSLHFFPGCTRYLTEHDRPGGDPSVNTMLIGFLSLLQDALQNEIGLWLH